MEGRFVSSFSFISGSEIDFQNDRIPLLDMSESGRSRSKITSPNDLLEGIVINVSGDYLTTGSADNRYVNLTGDQTISGVKGFFSRPTVNGTGVLLSGEATAQSTGYLTGYVNKSETGNFYPINNPSGFITGLDLSNYATVPYVTGVSGIIQVQINVLNNQTGDFYLKTNPSGYVTESYVTGVSGYLEGLISASSAGVGSINGLSGIVNLVGTGNNTISTSGSSILISGYTGFLSGYQTVGNYVTSAETGQFYSSSNPSGFITGVNLSGYVTGSVVRPNETGEFLITGAADLRYVGLTGTQIISGNKTFENNVKLSVLSGNGVVKTSGSNGSLYIDTGVYLVYQQQSNVAVPTGGSVIDDESRLAISGILLRLQSLGLFA